MKKHLLIITGILLFALYMSSGCKKDDDNDTNEYLIQIDSIQIPDTIDFGSLLDVDFYGLVGTTDCHAFSRFEQLEPVASDPQNSIRIQTLGVYNDNGNCQSQDVYMNPATLQIAGMFAGNFLVLAVQPDGTIMTATCYVRE
jgi:hypothetical protein